MSDLPVGWENYKLGEFIDFKNGINTDKSQYGKGYKFVNVMDIFNNDFLTENIIIGRVDIDEKKLEGNNLNYGDILFNRTSETFDEIVISTVFLDNKPATFGGFVIRGRPNSEYLFPNYSIYVFQSSSFRSQAIRLGQGAIRSNIGQKDLSKVTISLPPLPEQRKIAQILSTWDKAIATTEKQIANSKQQKKALMQQLLTGKKRLAGFSGDWVVVKLGDVVNCLDNRRVPLNGEQRDKMRGTIPYWGANGIVDYINDHIFDETIVLLAEDGGYFDEFSSRPIANISYGKSWVNNHAHVLTAKSGLSNDWLYFSLVHKNIMGFISGGTRAKLNKKDMLMIKIPLPPLKEQQKIAQVITTADNEISTLETQLTHLQQEKKALMQQLLTGKRLVLV